MRADIAPDVAAIGRIAIVQTALEILRRTTGLRMALVARVTDDSWTACAVLDDAEWGLTVGLELDVTTTYCRTVSIANAPILISHASADPIYRHHPAVHHYKIESYIAVPLRRRNGDAFGVLCALDPNPSELSPEHLDTMRLLASLISHELEAEETQRRLEDDLAAAHEAARTRERVVGVLSHDLRTPLTSVVLGAQHLASVNRLGAEDHQTAVAVLGSARRATRMVTDLLDFTRAKLAGGLPIDAKRCDLASITEKIVAEIRTNSAREIHVDIHGHCEGHWDADRAAQVVANLVNNAVTHGSESDPITVRVSSEGNAVVLEVVNNAEPIAEADLEQLFSPFRQAPTTHRDGLGLGLFIVRQIMTSHDGSIELAQSDGQVRLRAIWPR
jgi:signal transduction histidine kinase